MGRRMGALSHLRKPTVPFLYKYGSLAKPERLRGILLDHKLYFPNSEELNDPTECLPVVADHSVEELITFLSVQWLTDHSDASTAERDKAIAQIHYNARQFGKEVLIREMRRLLEQKLEGRFGILSLSKSKDSLSLWAHYGANHTGYCLEFRNAPPIMGAYEVLYAEKRPYRFSSNQEEYQADFLFTKHPNWASEEEVRILVRSPGLQAFPAAHLSSVILGKDAHEEHVRSVLEWARARAMPLLVFRTELDSISKALVRKPIRS